MHEGYFLNTDYFFVMLYSGVIFIPTIRYLILDINGQLGEFDKLITGVTIIGGFITVAYFYKWWGD